MNDEKRHDHTCLWFLLAAALLLVVIVTVVIVLSVGHDTTTTATTDPDSGSATTQGAPPEPDPEVALAPDFSVTLFDGTEFSLNKHLADDGRPVLLNLWASWCDPCRDEMPDIDSAAGEHPNVFFLGIAVDDTREAARAFAETIGVMYPLGADDSGEVGDAYPILGLPVTFLIDGDGTIAVVAYGQLSADRIEELLSTVGDRS